MATNGHFDLTTETLLPEPRSVAFTGEVRSVESDIGLSVSVEDERVKRAALDWRSSLQPAPEEHRGSGGLPACDARAGDELTVAVDRSVVAHPQGYRLLVDPERIGIIGGAPAGCFYALMTLRQLTDCTAGRLPVCRIEDQPDFETRGFLHDVTRGKVPTLDTLTMIADRLARFKINQFQLNIEHAFVFSFDPTICGPNEGLTPDEVHALDEYCQDRFIDLVPALATFGHMGRILSMPKYRHLAEVSPERDWAAQTWQERARGLTLDCTVPEAHRLVERMWGDVLDAFSSPVVNICGDEPHDLGKGGSAGRYTPAQIGEAYVNQLRRTQDICAARGRTTQVWSDVITNYPHLIDRLAPETAVLHWGYDDAADYDGTAKFVATGLATHVCPGTCGWKRVLNAMDLAERNISTFAAAGRRSGARGLITADWGDHGHFNLLACSWHGMALGAACGWRADHPIGAAFDKRFVRTMFGIDDARLVSCLRAASRIAEKGETWTWLRTPAEELAGRDDLPTLEQIEATRRAAEEGGKRIAEIAAGMTSSKWPLAKRLRRVSGRRAFFPVSSLK
ncbi:MAG: family 20 glycosylhydrolase [Planctomycetes bacterium]|nr:family 20 glycosylhydrolase [Planctomycetota bacterium]